MTPEPSYDPTDDIIANLDDTGEIAIAPLQLIARMHAEGSLDDDERDAAEILHRMYRVGSAKLRDNGRYDARDAEGKWAPVSEPRSAILAKVDTTIEAIRVAKRRRAVRHALAAREPIADIDALHNLAAGIGEVRKIWWGTRRTQVVQIGGISMPALSFGDYRIAGAVNDNKIGAKRVLDGFDRMHARRQLDKDPAMNDALYEAGRRYRAEHHGAGLTPLGAIDYARPAVDGTPVAGDRSGALTRFRRSRACMAERFAAVVDAVVLEGRTLEDAGCSAGIAGRGARIAIAGDRLASGLHDLADHYGMLRGLRHAS